jgi:hypothetical protein
MFMAFDDNVQITRVDSGSNTSSSAGPVLTVVNDTGYTFYYLYIAPSTSNSWGTDVLGAQTLRSGRSFRYTLPNTGGWDIKAVDSDGDSYTRAVSVNGDGTLTLTIQYLQ